MEVPGRRSDSSCDDNLSSLHETSSNPRFISYIRDRRLEVLMPYQREFKDIVMEGHDIEKSLTIEDLKMKGCLDLHKISQGNWKSFDEVISDTVYFCMDIPNLYCMGPITRAWTNFKLLVINYSTELAEEYYVFNDSEMLDEVENEAILKMLARDITESELLGKEICWMNLEHQMQKMNIYYDRRKLQFRTQLKFSDSDAMWYMVLNLRVKDSEGEEGKFADMMILGSALQTEDSFVNTFTFKSGKKLGFWLMEPPDIATLDRTLVEEGWTYAKLLPRKDRYKKRRPQKVQKRISGPMKYGKGSPSGQWWDAYEGSRYFRINMEIGLSEVGFITKNMLSKSGAYSGFNLRDDVDTAILVDRRIFKPILRLQSVPGCARGIVLGVLDKVITMSLMSQMRLDSSVVDSYYYWMGWEDAVWFPELLLAQIKSFFFTVYNHSLSDGMLLLIYFILIKKFDTFDRGYFAPDSPALSVVEGVEMKESCMMLKRVIDEQEKRRIDKQEIEEVCDQFRGDQFRRED